MGFISSGGNIPVNAPDVIAILILSHFAKGHASTLKFRMVFSPKNMIRQSSGLYFNGSYLFEK